MQAKKEISLILVIMLAAALLTGCSDLTTIQINENGSGTYTEEMTLSKSAWDILFSNVGTDDSVVELYHSILPTASVTIQEVTENGIESKQLKVTDDFKDTAQFQQLLSAMGTVSIKFNSHYYSSGSIYMPLDDGEEDTLLPDELETIFGENPEAMAALGAELQNMNVCRTITFPYNVTATNGVLGKDGRTVSWTVDMNSLNADSQQTRCYAVFGEQNAKTAPVFTGAQNGKNYNTGVTLNIDSANLLDKVIVNNETVVSDYLFLSTEGLYKITATDQGGNTSKIQFRIDTTKPVIKGVVNGKTYKKTCTIKFSDSGSGIKKATLNGKSIKTGKKVTKKGSYTLVVTDKAGNSKTVKFKIKK